MSQSESLLPSHRLPQEHPILRKRLGGLMILALVFGLIVGTRLFHLNVLNGSAWAAKAEANFLKPRPIPPARGLILDRHGEPLAENVPTLSISIIRYKKSGDEIAEVLAELKRLSGRQLMMDTDAVMRSWPSWRAVKLLRRLPLTEAAPLLEQLGGWDCLRAEIDYRRRYPDPRTTAHITGYLRQIPKEQMEARLEAGYRREDLVGWTALEAGWEEALRGRHGNERRVTDALNREREAEIAEEPQPGEDLQLTIDLPMQRAAFDALAATGKAGSLVALDVRSGAVLALANAPSFDSNTRVIKSGVDSAWNRALRTPLPPASTLKPFISVALLENGLPTKGNYFCGGYFKFPNYGHRFHCDHRSGCGSMRLEDALRRSCNVYYFRGANSLGQAKIEAILRRFGFGSATRIGMELATADLAIAENSGALGPERRGNIFNQSEVYPGDVIQAAIGQGTVEATTVQLARATAALANGGTLWQPFIVAERLSPEDGRPVWRFKPQGRRIQIDRRHRARIVDGMRQVVTRSDGTADHVGFDPAWRVAGKTGTAERGNNTDGWFMCFAPAEAPQVAIACVVEEGGAGGRSAAPIIKEALAAWFSR